MATRFAEATQVKRQGRKENGMVSPEIPIIHDVVCGHQLLPPSFPRINFTNSSAFSNRLRASVSVINPATS